MESETNFQPISSVPFDRPAITEHMGYHEFVESEFPEGAGRCDQCGGGPGAAIHQKPVDPLDRIATCLERLCALVEEVIVIAKAQDAIDREEDRDGR